MGARSGPGFLEDHGEVRAYKPSFVCPLAQLLHVRDLILRKESQLLTRSHAHSHRFTHRRSCALTCSQHAFPRTLIHVPPRRALTLTHTHAHTVIRSHTPSLTHMLTPSPLPSRAPWNASDSDAERLPSRACVSEADRGGNAALPCDERPKEAD